MFSTHVRAKLEWDTSILPRLVNAPFQAEHHSPFALQAVYLLTEPNRLIRAYGTGSVHKCFPGMLLESYTTASTFFATSFCFEPFRIGGVKMSVVLAAASFHVL